MQYIQYTHIDAYLYIYYNESLNTYKNAYKIFTHFMLRAMENRAQSIKEKKNKKKNFFRLICKQNITAFYRIQTCDVTICLYRIPYTHKHTHT